MKFKTKSVNYTGEELKLPVTVDGVDYPAGSILMTSDDGEQQFIVTKEEVSANFDEIKPRVRTSPESGGANG